MITDKKERILLTALKMFVENGIDATSTAKIAKNAEVASGLIFHHFGNKENLIRELYIHIKEIIAIPLRNIVDLSAFTESKFKTIWRVGIEIGLENILSVKFLHQYSYSRFIDKSDRNKGKELFSGYREFFQNGIDNGILKKIDSDLIAELVFEQNIFLIMYMYENNISKKEILKFYPLIRDMIFI